jgi:hypothetical protein
MTAAPIHLDDDIEQAGAFYPGLTHSLYGESESGKSLIAQWAVIEQLAADQRVLYVDFESTADQIVPRLVALAAGYGLDLRGKVAAGLLDYVSPQGRITQTFIDNYLAPGRYAMAIVDGVTASISMWGAKSKDGDEFTAWHHDLPERIARMTGAAVIVIDHVNKSGDGSRFATGTQAKMAVLTGAAYLIDVKRPFAPGRVGEVIMQVAKDRPGDVRAHAGEVAANRLQPWARVTVDGAKDGSKITLAIEPVDDGEGLDDDLPGTSGFDVPNWKDVAVPDEVAAALKGKGSGRASDVIRVLWAVGTEDGLTEAAVRAAWAEGQGDMGKNASSRWREAWACAMRSKGLAHGSGGASRWTLANHFEAMLGGHNARP